MTFWFFATPIIYPFLTGIGHGPTAREHAVLNLNPFTHLAVSYQEILFFDGPFGHWRWLLALAGAVARCCSWPATSCSTGCATRSRRKCDGPRDRSRRTSRRSTGASAHRRQFATLKSALLAGTVAARPAARRDVRGACATCRSQVPKGSTFGVIGRNGSGKSTVLKLVAGITKPTEGTRARRRPHLRAHRARRRLPPGDLRPRERLHQRHHARPHEARDRPALRRDRRVRRAARLHRRAGQDLLVRACTCASASPWPSTWIPTCCWSTRCSPSATRRSRTSASTSSPSSAAAARRSSSSPTRSTWSSGSATRCCGSMAGGVAATATHAGSCRQYITDVAKERGARRWRPTTRERSRAGQPPSPCAAAAPDVEPAAATAAADGAAPKPTCSRRTEGRWGSREVEITERATLVGEDGQPATSSSRANAIDGAS